MFRFVILGAGNIAHSFARAAQQVPGAQIVAVAARDGARAAAFARKHGIPASFGSYEAALNKTACDCAYIATLPATHAMLCKLCFARHIPVLCEKTAFRSAAEAEDALTPARENHTFFMEALWSKFLPALQTARRWIREGRIGQPRLAGVTIGFRAPQGPDNRYFDPALGGGAALDITVYAYQLLRWLLPYDWRLDSVLVKRGATGTDDTEILTLSSENCLATLHTTFEANTEEKLEVCGTEGRLVIPMPHMAKTALLPDAGESFKDADVVHGFVYEIREVMRCVGEGLLESPEQTWQNTLDYARVIDRIAGEGR